MQRFRKKFVRYGIGFVLFSLFCGFAFWIVNDKENALQQEKRHHLDLVQSLLTDPQPVNDPWNNQPNSDAWNDVPLDIDNKKWLQEEFEKKIEGKLVCAKRKAPKIVNFEELEGVGKLKSRNPVTASEIIAFGSSKRNEKKASITQVTLNQPVGCCPVGSDKGVAYMSGSACCNRTIYNASTHFCCVSDRHNYRVFKLNTDELDYCYPIDGILYCREVDLEMESAYPMKHECEHNARDFPISCRFYCPEGSRPRGGIELARCRSNGVWDKKPLCCKGCEKNHQLDLWFLIQVKDNNELEDITNFLKKFLLYLPISQESVRVGFYLFGDKTEDEVWDLFSQEDRDSLYHTIDNLSVGRKAESGATRKSPLTRLSTYGFTEDVGDREGVENHVIAIIKSPLGDSMFQGAIDLKRKARVMSIAIGTDFSDEDLLAIVTQPKYSYRVQHTENLPTLTMTLHNAICGENCIFDLPR